MKIKDFWKYTSITVVVLLALAVVGTVLGQGPDTGDPGGESTSAIAGEPIEFPDEVDEGSEGQKAPPPTVAQPPYQMNY